MLNKAVQIATTFHKGQVDKIGNPYILPPLRVMLSMNTLNEQVVGVLHDVIEDTPAKLEDFEGEFPEEIIEAIDAITKRKGEINLEYLERCCKNPIAKNVKVVDILDNLSPIRMLKLEKNEQEKLRKKYYKGIEILLGSE